MEITEAEGEKKKVYVAVPEEFKKGKSALVYAINNSSKEVTIIICHVHVPPQTIPMAGGVEFHVSKMNAVEVAAYRREVKIKSMKKLDQYLSCCKKAKFKGEKLVIENDDVAQGILVLIAQHGIKTLIMGAAEDKHYSKNLKTPKSKTAIAVMQNAEPSCKILFVCKNMLIFTRDLRSVVAPTNMPEEQPEQLPQQMSLLQLHQSRDSGFLQKSTSVNGAFPGMPPQGQATRRKFLSVGNSLFSPLDGNWGSSSGSSSMPSAQNTASFVIASGPSLASEQNTGVSSIATSSSFQSEEEYVAGVAVQEYDEDLQRSSHHNGLGATRKDSNLHVKLHEAVFEAAKFKVEVSEEYCRRQVAEVALEMSKEAHAIEMEQLKAQLQIAKEQSKQLQSKLTTVHQSREFEHEKSLKEAKKLRKKLQELDAALAAPNTEFSYSELEQATQNFSESMKIGEGGFAIVYKGFIRNTVMAIKMLKDGSLDGKSQFEREVAILSRVRHPNLVTLIGACYESSTLVYEFLPNGSLEDRLICSNNSPPLSWQTRVRIICEICSALIFLHMNKPNPVVHGDLKPANILLDANLGSKISDFGISRLLIQGTNNTSLVYCTSRPIGSPAYMDPEFFTSGELSTQSDTYSFGIIILRLLTRKSPFNIVNIIKEALENDALLPLVDASAGDWPFEQAKELAELGLRCAKMKRKKRPKLIDDVWKVLEPMRNAASISMPKRIT